MKPSILVNHHRISDQEAANLFEFDSERQVNFWDLSWQMSGYGHWKISAKIEVDGHEFVFSNVTTNSKLIDELNGYDHRDEDEEYEYDNPYLGAFDILLNDYEVWTDIEYKLEEIEAENEE